MSLSVKVGTITAKTTTGNQAYTGVGFQPKALIFYATLETADGYAANTIIGVGFAVSTSQRFYISEVSQDAVAGATNSQKAHDALAIGLMAAGGAVAIAADLVSMDADGFTLNWTTANGSAIVINYLAIGGSDVTNVFAGRYTTIAGATQAVTGVGFTPDLVLCVGNDATTWPLTGSNHGKMSIGAFTASAQGATTVRDNGNATTNSDAAVYQRTTKSYVGLSSTAATVLQEFDRASMDADGFTLNSPTVNVGAHFLYLAIKGGRFWVGNETQKTSTGTKAKTGVGFRPKGLLTFGVNAAASATVNAGGKLSVGASDGTTSRSAWAEAQSGVPTREDNSATAAVAVRHATGPSTTNAEASLSSFDADGFTLNWTTADATAREFLAVAFGDLGPVKFSPVGMRRPVVYS
jgi:hypothetical protein